VHFGGKIPIQSDEVGILLKLGGNDVQVFSWRRFKTQRVIHLGVNHPGGKMKR
jgi:hypothetical protein